MKSVLEGCELFVRIIGKPLLPKQGIRPFFRMRPRSSRLLSCHTDSCVAEPLLFLDEAPLEFPVVFRGEYLGPRDNRVIVLKKLL